MKTRMEKNLYKTDQRTSRIRFHSNDFLLTVEELLEWIPAAEEVPEDVERVSEDKVQPRIHAAERIALQIENELK